MEHQVVGQLEAFGALARTLQRNLELIESDRELARRGYQLIYAVDFNEIRRFLLPAAVLPDDGVTEPIPGESSESGLVRQHLALTFVFEHLGHDLLILPPHQIEMSDHFHMRRSLYNDSVTRDPQLLVEHLSRSLTDQKLFRSIAALLEREPARSGLSATQLRKMAQYIRVHFKELLALLASIPAGRTGMDEPVRHLLKRCRTRPYVDYFGYSELQFDTVFEASAGWFERLKDGYGPHRENDAYTDSLACAYLERTNRAINSRKEVMLFFTSSAPVAAVLRDRELIDGECAAQERSVIRDLNYFWALLQHHRKDPQEMDEALSRTKKLLERMRRVFAGSSALQEGELPHAFDRSVAALLSDLSADLRSRENLGLALSSETLRFGEAQTGSIAGLTARHSAGLRNIFRASTSHDDVLRRLRDDAARADADLAEHISDLDLLLHSIRPGVVPSVRAHSHRAADGSSLALDSPVSELPSEVRMYNPQVQRIASGLLAQYAVRGSGKAWQALVLDLNAVRERDPELHLFRAYLFGSIGNWSSALSEVSMALDSGSLHDVVRREILHLKTALHRVQEQTEEGIISCAHGLRLDPSDPRLNRELAVLLCQALRTSLPDERRRWSEIVREHVGQEPDYALALWHADRALSTLEGPEATDWRCARSSLYAHALNTCGSLALELFRIRHDLSYLILAERRMVQLRAVLQEDGWPPGFFHTMGCVVYQRWDLSREHVDELREAKRYFKEAVSDSRVDAPELRLYQRDLEQISEQLRKLGYSDHAEPRSAQRVFAT